MLQPAAQELYKMYVRESLTAPAATNNQQQLKKHPAFGLSVQTPFTRVVAVQLSAQRC